MVTMTSCTHMYVYIATCITCCIDYDTNNNTTVVTLAEYFE